MTRSLHVGLRGLFLGLALGVALPVAAAADCTVVARFDQSSRLHAAAGALGYTAGRVVGFGGGRSLALGIGMNLVKETYDFCGSHFDFGDLAAGSLGAAFALIIDRSLQRAFGGSGQRVESLSMASTRGVSLGFRISF